MPKRDSIWFLSFALVASMSFAGMAQPTPALTAITWNVEQPQGRRLQRVAEFLARRAPDVIAVQEIYEEEADELRRRLATLTSRPWSARYHRGVLVLTATGIVEGEDLWMPFPDASGAGRPATRVTIERAGHRVHVVNTHLTNREVQPRQFQTNALLGWMRNLAGPILLAGDFNATPADPEIREASTPHGRGMAAYFRDVWEGPGGETHGNPDPTRRIDYWFVKRGDASVLAREPQTLDVCGANSLAADEAGQAGAMCLSDHRPVEVTFILAGK